MNANSVLSALQDEGPEVFRAFPNVVTFLRHLLKFFRVDYFSAVPAEGPRAEPHYLENLVTHQSEKF